MEVLRTFVGKKERRRIEAYNKEKMRVFHETIMDDDTLPAIDDQIAKLQESMQIVDSRFKFPKRSKDKSGIDKTMSIINNVSELLENSKAHAQKMQTFKNADMDQLG